MMSPLYKFAGLPYGMHGLWVLAWGRDAETSGIGTTPLRLAQMMGHGVQGGGGDFSVEMSLDLILPRHSKSHYVSDYCRWLNKKSTRRFYL